MIIMNYIIQIKICAEYRDMLPNPGVPSKSRRGMGSMSRYSAQILFFS